jgi:hypothetical protein
MPEAEVKSEVSATAEPAAAAPAAASAAPAKQEAKGTDWEAEAKAARKEAAKAAKEAESAAKAAAEQAALLDSLKTALGAGKKEDPLEKASAALARASALEQRVRNSIVREAMRSIASDAHDVSDILHNLPASAFDVDVDGEALKNAEAVSELVAALRAKKPHLFKAPAAAPSAAAAAEKGPPLPMAARPPAAKQAADGGAAQPRPTDLHSLLTKPVKSLRRASA